tara:strand:+ start:9035 stop:9145 length:111 start_codon:yes stop_codon:yes gene_type:complete
MLYQLSYPPKAMFFITAPPEEINNFFAKRDFLLIET